MLLLMAPRNSVNSPVEGKVAYPMIYEVRFYMFYASQVGVWDFFQQWSFTGVKTTSEPTWDVSIIRSYAFTKMHCCHEANESQWPSRIWWPFYLINILNHTWRIIPISKWLVTSIYKPWSSAIWKGSHNSHNPILRGQQLSPYITMVINHTSWDDPPSSPEE